MGLSQRKEEQREERGKKTADRGSGGRGKKDAEEGRKANKLEGVWWYTGLRQPGPAPSAVHLHWLINRKKNGPLYLSGAGQESSADVIKILSSPVKDTYHSSSAQLALSEKENQPNRWGLSFHS